MRFIRLAALAAVILIFELLAGIRIRAGAPDRARSSPLPASPVRMNSRSSSPTTTARRAMGLMFRRSMGAEEGMLFDFGVRAAGELLDAQYLHPARHAVHQGGRHD